MSLDGLNFRNISKEMTRKKNILKDTLFANYDK